jgi:hypothetical protein
MADITAAVEEARGMKPSGQVGAPSAEAVAPELAAEATTEAVATEPAPEAPAATTEPAPDPLRARESKLVEQQTRFQREKREFETYRSRVESELAQAREIVRMSQADPLGYFEKYHGLKPDAFVEALGAQAQQRKGGAPAAAAALPPEVARELEEGRQFRQSLEQERRQRRIADEQENFARSAKEGAQRWPIASKISAERLKSRGWEIAVAHANQGVSLTNDEILDKLEDELAEYTSAVKPQGTKQVTAAAVGQNGTSAGKTASQPTLSARGSSEPNPPAKPFVHPLSKDRISNGVLAVQELLKKKA